MSDNKGVLILGELTEEGRLASITMELLGIGRKLADEMGEELGVVILGWEIYKSCAKDAATFGADKIYIVNNPMLKDYQNDSYQGAMESVCRKMNPNILLIGQTTIGRDLAPRLAFRLQTGVGMNCVDLGIDPDSRLLVMTRPVYGGNAMAETVCNNCFPQIATVRAKTMIPLECDNSRECNTVPLNVQLDSSVTRVKILGQVKEKETTGVKLEDADVVVCGGRGMGENALDELSQLAKILDGAIGGTRGICDMGQIPTTNQIGLTGKIVAPKLYIGIGLSGSSQHLSGCSGSKTIVAVNTDPDANIFNVAGYGIVGDYKKALPAFTEKCKEFLKKDSPS